MEVAVVAVVEWGWGWGGNERSHLHAVKKTKPEKKKAEIHRDEGSPAAMAKLHLILEECLPGAYSNRT